MTKTDLIETFYTSVKDEDDNIPTPQVDDTCWHWLS